MSELLIKNILSNFPPFLAYILQTEYEQFNLWQYFQTFYRLLLGDFGNYNDISTLIEDNLYFLILLTATIILVIVMLNLLIAIISDTFEKVMAEIRQNEVHEQLQLILEFFSKDGILTDDHNNNKDDEKSRNYLQRNIRPYRYVLQIKKKEIPGMNDQEDRIRTRLGKFGKETKQKLIGLDKKLNDILNNLKKRDTIKSNKS